jgi:hypothetical protein
VLVSGQVAVDEEEGRALDAQEGPDGTLVVQHIAHPARHVAQPNWTETTRYLLPAVYRDECG